MIAKLPAHSRDAERGVLGSMLRLNAAIDDVVQMIRRDDFYLDAHQKLFDAMTALWTDNRPVDLVTLADELHRRGQVEDVGGYAYVGELWEAAPTAANACYYAGIVRDKAILRGLARAAQRIAQEADSPTGPAEESLAMAEREIFALAEVGTKGGAVPLADGLSECLDRLDLRMTRKAADGAVPTGFLDLDAMTCGLQAGELVILAARPSTGKTALSLAIARHALEAGFPVFFASLEQPRVDLAERLVCCESGVDYSRIRAGKLSGEEVERVQRAAAYLRGLPLFIDDAPGQSMLRIAANLRRLKRRHGVKLAVVDYLQLVEPEDRKASRQEQVAVASRRLKHLAREAGVPVLCLAQLNREVEYRSGGKPKLADLRDSGEIEQNADTVMLLHKPEDAENVVEVIIAKQRNGPVGERSLTFLKQYMRFENYAVESPFPRRCRLDGSPVPVAQ